MTYRKYLLAHRKESVNTGLSILKWIGLAGCVGILAGFASALFLWLLDLATDYRVQHPWLLFGLPFCGLAVGAIYSKYGKSVAGGNNLLLDNLHQSGERIPFRMGPFVLGGTVLTHLFGGSAGREGTAVQMGGSLADLLVGVFKLDERDRKLMIMAGISAGFGSVFGTPIAGTVFGLEVASIGSLRYEAIVPCLVASLVGDLVCRGLGIHHHSYSAPGTPSLNPSLFGFLLLASIAFGLASVGFVELTHWISGLGKSMKHSALVKPMVGGLVVVLLTLVVGNQDYNGLGIPLIDRSLHEGSVPLYAFALKLVFTAITLGTGFKGGEVTPLFCIGATLGAAFGHVTHQDPTLFAVLGFVGVFAGAANTPLACTLMGIELFGSHLATPIAVVCVVTYIISGHRGIYSSQRVSAAKVDGAREDEGGSLKAIRDGRVLIYGRAGSIPNKGPGEKKSFSRSG